MAADVERVLETPAPVDVRRTVGALGLGAFDPTTHADRGEVWRATRTPEGPATFRVTGGREQLHFQAWGPGAAWVAARAAGLCGLEDDPAALVPNHRALADLVKRLAGLRLTRGLLPSELLVRTACQQRVTWREAAAQYRALTLAVLEPAPGPGDLALPPDPAELRHRPPWALASNGLDADRARVVLRVAVHAKRLDETVAMSRDDAWRRMTAVPGIGPWTAAIVMGLALGDPDAVPVGDYHLPNTVAWVLAGEPRGDEARMAELLEPWRGQRGRVVRLIKASGLRAPAYGPRRGSWASDIKR